MNKSGVLFGGVLFVLSACGASTRLATNTFGAASIDKVDAILTYPAAQGAAFSSGADPSKRLRYICALPPAQAATQFEQSKALSVDGSSSNEKQGKFSYLGIDVEAASKVDLALAVEYASRRAETIAKLYEQNERTLLFQFALYRLCEAFNNGMLTIDQNADYDFVNKIAELKSAKVRAESEIERLKPELELALTSFTDASAKVQDAEARMKNLVSGSAKPTKPEELNRLDVLKTELAAAQKRATVEGGRLEELKSKSAALGTASRQAEAMASVYAGQLNQNIKYNGYEVQFQRILEMATRMSEDRRVLEAEARVAAAESNVKLLEAMAAKTKAEEAKTKADDELKSTKDKLKVAEEKLKEDERKMAEADKVKAQAELDAYKKCVESKSCTGK